MFKKLKILLKIANQIYGIVKELSKKVEAKKTIIEKINNYPLSKS